MAKGTGVEVIGDKLLLARLAALMAVDDKAQKALAKGGEVIRDDAQRRTKSRTVAGHIKDRRDDKESKAGHQVHEIYAEDERAAIEEFGGHINVAGASVLSEGGAGGDVFGKVVEFPARPYMRPAVDENHDKIRTAIEDEMGARIQEME